MSGVNQHVIVRSTNGNFAATTYGPRTTTNRVPLHRPVRAEQRQIVLQLDGDILETLEADFADDALTVLRPGDFVTDIRAFSVDGGTATLELVDRDGTVTALPPQAPAANAWSINRDLDISIVESSQIVGTIGAGEQVVVVIQYWSAETPGDGGVLHRTRDNALVPGVDFFDPDGNDLPGPNEDAQINGQFP